MENTMPSAHIFDRLATLVPNVTHEKLSVLGSEQVKGQDVDEAVFEGIMKIANSNSYETNIEKHSKSTTICITQLKKLKLLLKKAVPVEQYIERSFAHQGVAKLIVSRERPVIISYNYTRQILKVKCHFGFSNSSGVQQQ